MPDPKVDPHLIAVRTHANRLRLELDRLDRAVSDYDGPGQGRITAVLLILREALDELDLRVDAEAAGL